MTFFQMYFFARLSHLTAALFVLCSFANNGLPMTVYYCSGKCTANGLFAIHTRLLSVEQEVHRCVMYCSPGESPIIACNFCTQNSGWQNQQTGI